MICYCVKVPLPLLTFWNIPSCENRPIPLTVFPDLTVDRSCRYFPEQFGGKVSGIQQTNIRLKL
jgi:hypothetical protein